MVCRHASKTQSLGGVEIVNRLYSYRKNCSIWSTNHFQALTCSVSVWAEAVVKLLFHLAMNQHAVKSKK